MNTDYIKLLRDKKDKLLLEAAKIDDAISIFEKYINDSVSSISGNNEAVILKEETKKLPKGYDINDSLVKKLFFILNEKQRFLHNREIAEYINNLEPDNSIEDIISKLSPILSRFKNENELVNVRDGLSNIYVYWGSPKWLDESGKIKEEHKYIPIPKKKHFKIEIL